MSGQAKEPNAQQQQTGMLSVLVMLMQFFIQNGLTNHPWPMPLAMMATGMYMYDAEAEEDKKRLRLQMLTSAV